MIKLIATDLDGTLLNHKNEISLENIKAIKDAQKKGIEVVIATGRSHFDALKISSKADLCCPIISNNGSCIHDKYGKILYSLPIPKKELIKTVSWLEKEGFYYEVSNDKYIYTPFRNSQILDTELDKLSTSNPEVNINELKAYAERLFAQRGVITINNCKEIFNKEEEFFNILAFSFDENKRQYGMTHCKKFENLSLFSSANHNFEMININTSKGDALEKLCTLLDISLQNSMAIGDNYNDITMIKKAKYGIAMGNAEDFVKSLSSFVTLNNDKNGVAHAIYKFVC